MARTQLKTSNMAVDNGLHSPTSGNNLPKIAGIDADDSVAIVKVALGVVATGGGVSAIENNTGNAYLVDLSYIDVTTKTTGACTIDAGVAANGTTLSDTLMDGVDVNAATIIANNIDNKGTNGGIGIKLANGQFLTISQASGAIAGIVGNAYFKLIRV